MRESKWHTSPMAAFLFLLPLLLPPIAAAFPSAPAFAIGPRPPSPRGATGPRRASSSPPGGDGGGDGGPSIEMAPHFVSEPVLSWLGKMAGSYRIERGEDLLEAIAREDPGVVDRVAGVGDGRLLGLAAACAASRLPVASHDFLRDPADATYCYGNGAFLDGFGYEWEEFVRLPSRKCVDTDEAVDERQRLLDDALETAVKADGGTKPGGEGSRDGDGDDGKGGGYDNLVRVRKDGRKILLRGVNLWNVYDVPSEGDAESWDAWRAGIERGEVKAIGQAVWIHHVEDLD